MPLVTCHDNGSIEKQLFALSLGHLVPHPAYYSVAFIPLKAFQTLEKLIEQAHVLCRR